VALHLLLAWVFSRGAQDDDEGLLAVGRTLHEHMYPALLREAPEDRPLQVRLADNRRS
jgi:hypothetical protein